MIRFLLVLLLAFFLPFAVWYGWRFIQQVLKPESELEPEAAAPPPPFARLIIIGAVLSVATMMTLAVLNQSETGRDGLYQPPRLEDGKTVPGRFAPREPEEPEDEPAQRS